MIYEYRAADAFPIYFGQYVHELEQHTCLLRGNPARSARFGELTPLIHADCFTKGKSQRIREDEEQESESSSYLLHPLSSRIRWDTINTRNLRLNKS